MNVRRAIRVLFERDLPEEPVDLHKQLYGHAPIWLSMWVDDEDRERGIRDGDRWCQCGRVERTGAFRYAWQEEGAA